MSYVLVAILFLLIASAFVAYLVLTATKRSSPAREETGPPGIGRDETPLGDTSQHAGETSSEGRTVGGQDAGPAGGTGRPVLSDADEDHAREPAAPEPDRRFQRDPVGGEAEARPFTSDV